ncbi:unnamed protein product [Schistosoma bovis]|nr:unnamed protein product [Schistosoma bovis]
MSDKIKTVQTQSLSSMASTINVKELVEQMKYLLQDLKSCPVTDKLITNEENIIRFLKARSWDLQSAEKMIRKDVQWRQEFRPDLTDCKNCHNQPGTHSLRQIGFDEAGRPIIYASFCQAISNRNMSNDAVTHLIYTIENAIKSMKSGVTQWVFVIDCTALDVHHDSPINSVLVSPFQFLVSSIRSFDGCARFPTPCVLCQPLFIFI